MGKRLKEQSGTITRMDRRNMKELTRMEKKIENGLNGIQMERSNMMELTRGGEKMVYGHIGMKMVKRFLKVLI